MNSFKLSLSIGVGATLLALLVGVPTSYALSRYHMKSKQLLKFLFVTNDDSGYRCRLFLVPIHCDQV